MMSKIPILKPQEVVRILESFGFVEVRQKGSHKQFRHEDVEEQPYLFTKDVIFHLDYYDKLQVTLV
ncbi:type II toxin-antitoxin system HicA family toxin [Nostoc sp.]|uniref:type II toxin-antitoxin system HicA family toxin n=1 Tax=Nostoc sp. TaxID=1180 RepID=UPI0035941BEB